MALLRRKAKLKDGPVDVGKIFASNPYVQRFAEDPQLRESVLSAYEAGRSAYARMANGKGPGAVIDDKKVQRDLRRAAASINEAATLLRRKPKGKRRRRRGMLLLVGIAGAGAAVALNQELREKLLDTVFGAEEEFEYTSTTDGGGASAPEPASVGAPPSSP